MLTSAAPTSTNLETSLVPDNTLAYQKIPVYAFVKNKCNFSIWVRQTIQARCDEHPNTAAHEIRPGEEYRVEKAAKNDDCGMVVKMARGPEMYPIYHAEYVVHWDGSIWYNFSHEGMNNARPFRDMARWMTVYGKGPKCVPLYCATGDGGTGCDYNDGTDAHINNCKVANAMSISTCADFSQ